MRKLLVAIAMIAVLVAVPTSAMAASPTPFFNGFETDTAGWNGAITRQQSGYSNAGGYADGIVSASGGYHARLGTDGAFTTWGGYTDTFPVGGYTTSLTIYLDVSWASSHPDARFDWDVSSSNSSGGFLRDFVFNAGTTPSNYLGTPGFVINASTNAMRSSSSPSNPCPSPSTAPNTCRMPVYITTSGWYTFVHTFSDGGANGLQVDMSILDSSGNTVASWTIYSGDPMSAVGGNQYGWFANQEINDLPIDNSALEVSLTPTDKDQCKNGGWQQFNSPTFKNQGDCIQFVNTGK